MLVDGERYSEDDLIGAIDAGAEDVAPDGDVLKVDRRARRPHGGARGARGRRGRDRVRRAGDGAERGGRDRRGAEARALVRLMESLDDHDDVEAVHANFDIPEALLEQVAA